MNADLFTIQQVIDDLCNLVDLKSIEKWQSPLVVELTQYVNTLYYKYPGQHGNPFNWENFTIAIEVLAWLDKTPTAMWKLKQDNAGVDQMVGECVEMIIDDTRKSLNGFLDAF